MNVKDTVLSLQLSVKARMFGGFNQMNIWLSDSKQIKLEFWHIFSKKYLRFVDYYKTNCQLVNVEHSTLRKDNNNILLQQCFRKIPFNNTCDYNICIKEKICLGQNCGSLNYFEWQINTMYRAVSFIMFYEITKILLYTRL